MAADQSPYPDTGNDTGAGQDRGSTAQAPHRRPRWLKVSAIIVAALVLLFVILKLLGVGGGMGGMGGHGPSRHQGLGVAPTIVVDGSGQPS
jgi:hypothetical protein